MFEILMCIVIWFLFGWLSSEALIGNYTFAYPVDGFGPMNVYVTDDRVWSNEKDKKNARMKFWLLFGGAGSLVFMIGYFTIRGVKRFVKHLKWMYN